MVLGIRFPKQFEFAATSPTETPSTNALVTQHGSNEFNSASNLAIIPIAPARYSEVRKVVFHASMRLGSVSTKGRLRIAAMSTSTLNITPDPFTLAPSQIVRTAGSGTVFSVPAFFEAHLFAKTGDISSAALPVTLNQITGATYTLTVEFNRFEAGSADFFAFWDSQSDPDAYLGFKIVFERTDGGTTAAIGTMADIGVTIVQAPSTNNKSCTIVPMTIGYINDATMALAFPNGNRSMFFRYNAANWDHITSATILSYCYWTNASARNFNVGLHNVTGYEPTALNLLYQENFEDTLPAAAGGDATYCRSADVKGYLVDGADHCVLFDNQNAFNISNPCAWLEIVQEGYTNTECHHAQMQCKATTAAASAPYGSPATPPFDPTWYQSFPDDLILSRHTSLSLRHDNVVSNTTIKLFMDANLESDVTGLATSSVSIAGITPALSSTPTATAGTKRRFEDYITPDPINLAGMRRLVFGLTIGTSGATDYVGTAALIYVLAVPTNEVPEIGSVFDLDAFEPEGCASTAAGLGDPGMMVLTNGSSIPQKFNPQAALVEDAGIPAPFCDEPNPSTIVNDTAASPTGGLSQGIYRYRYTFRNCCTNKESNPSDADIEVDTSAASPAAVVTLNFTGVRIPGDTQICEICVYRTVVDGVYPIMAKVGCFDPSLTSTFEDQLADSELDFTNDGLSLLNAPMPCVPIVVDFANRLFGMGDIPSLSPAGTVTVVNGSDIVTGDDEVEWTRCLEGKYLQVEGDCRAYEIACVMPPEVGTSPALGRLKLVEPYAGENNTGALYTVCGRPNRIWFSEPFEPEYWPEANFVDVEPGDGDRIMGAVSNFDSLVICKRRKTYVMRFRIDPASEVFVPSRISSDIGCIAPRSFAQVESGSVWLSDRGLCLYDGRSVQMIPESVAFDSYFTDPDNENYIRRDSNGRVIGAVGVYYPKRQQYLLLLPTVQTERGANLLMVWDTQLRNITVHKFCQEFLSMTIGKDSDGNQRVYVGDTNGFVWILDIGDSDGVGYPGQTGTVRGIVTDSGIDPSLGVSYIEDTDASFITGGLPGLAGLSGVAGLSGAFAGTDLGLAGVCVFFRAADAEPDDPWESRVVFAATEQRLFVTPSFTTDAPPAGYEYMLGPIDFRASFKPTNFGDDDVLKRNWKHVLVHEPEEVDSIVRVQLIPDFQLSDDEEGSVVADDGTTGKGRLFNVNFSKGRQKQPVGRKIYNFEQVVLTNFAPESPVRIINHLLMIEPDQSK